MRSLVVKIAQVDKEENFMLRNLTEGKSAFDPTQNVHKKNKRNLRIVINLHFRKQAHHVR